MPSTDQRGKLVIVLMISIAVAMAGYAWWHQREAGRLSAEFWGTESAIAVRYAPSVEFVPLQTKVENADSTANVQVICGGEYVVGNAIDVTRTRGLVHARHALVDDLSYDWKAPTDKEAHWEFLLRFRDQDHTVTAAIDAEQGLVCTVDQSRVQQLIPKIAAAFRQKRDEWRKLVKPLSAGK